MAYVSAQKSRILLGDFALSPKVVQVGFGYTVDMLDVTTLVDSAKSFIPGQNQSSLSFDGFYDTETHQDLDAFTAGGEPCSYAPQGFALGSEVMLQNTLSSTFETSSAVADTVKFSLQAQPTGPTGFGVSLHDLTAETSDTNHTSVDGSAATPGGAVAHLHVTAYSGLDDAVFTIEDSANNSAFSTIGTFATLTGVGTERLAIAGQIRRYVRAVTNVTGTGSVTFAIGLARL